jgi:hypothetical protein
MTGFGRILDDLNGAGIRYVLIGGIALIRHRGPDLFPRRSGRHEAIGGSRT